MAQAGFEPAKSRRFELRRFASLRTVPSEARGLSLEEFELAPSGRMLLYVFVLKPAASSLKPIPQRPRWDLNP